MGGYNGPVGGAQGCCHGNTEGALVAMATPGQKGAHVLVTKRKIGNVAAVNQLLASPLINNCSAN